MDKLTASTPNGAGRKEIKVQHVSDEQINNDISKYTGNEETTLVANVVDVAVLEEIKVVEDSSSSGSSDTTSTGKKSKYIDAKNPGKVDLENVKNGMYINVKQQTSKNKADKKTNKEDKADIDKE